MHSLDTQFQYGEYINRINYGSLINASKKKSFLFSVSDGYFFLQNLTIHSEQKGSWCFLLMWNSICSS